MRLTLIFHPFDLAWLFITSFLQLNGVVAHAYVAWPFAIEFVTKMCSHIQYKTLRCIHMEKIYPLDLNIPLDDVHVAKIIIWIIMTVPSLG
jgi:hypothetical protein